MCYSWNPHLEVKETYSVGEKSPVYKREIIRSGKILDGVLDCHDKGQFAPTEDEEGITVFKGEGGRQEAWQTPCKLRLYGAQQESAACAETYWIGWERLSSTALIPTAT